MCISLLPFDIFHMCMYLTIGSKYRKTKWMKRKRMMSFEAQVGGAVRIEELFVEQFQWKYGECVQVGGIWTGKCSSNRTMDLVH